MEKFHQEVSTLKLVFKSSGYPKNKLRLTVPKLQLVCVLPYTGKYSLDLRARLKRTIEVIWSASNRLYHFKLFKGCLPQIFLGPFLNTLTHISFCKLKVIFRPTCRFGNFFRFKDLLEKKILSGIVYHYTCSNCKVTYYGKSFRQVLPKASEGLQTSNLTRKRIKNDNR